METTAVNPVLQSAIVDKYGRPFAEKTQKIVENLDLTVEKQDVVVEKQDQIGDKVKDVLSNLEGSGGNLGKAFGKSADGLKELTFGFVDIKGVLEEISKKFSAVGDLVAPLAEIGSFGFLTSSIGVNESGQVTVSDPDEKEDSPGIIDTSGNVIDIGDKKKSDEVTEKSNKKTLNFMERFRKSMGFVITGFKNLAKSLIPLIAKFVLMGLKFAVVAIGLAYLVKALGGWKFVEERIRDIELSLLRFANFLDRYVFFNPDRADKRETVIDFKEQVQEDKEEVNKLKKETIDEKGEVDEKKFEEKRIEQGLVLPTDTIDPIGRFVSQDGRIVNEETTSDRQVKKLKQSLEKPSLFDEKGKLTFQSAGDYAFDSLNPFRDKLNITNALLKGKKIKEQKQKEDEFLLEKGEIIVGPPRPETTTYTSLDGETVKLTPKEENDIKDYLMDTLRLPPRDLSPADADSTDSSGTGAIISAPNNVVNNNMAITSEGQPNVFEPYPVN